MSPYKKDEFEVLKTGAEFPGYHGHYTLPSINNYTHTKFDIHFQDSLNLN